MCEWKENILGPLCVKIGSGATPRGGSGVYLDEGEYALIRSQNVRDNYFDRNGLAYIENRHAKQLANVEVEENDVLLNITGDSVARCCQVDSGILPARVNQHVAIIRTDGSKLIPQFLRYYLISPLMKSRMLNLAAAGATRNALTKGMIEDFKIPLPPLPVQQRIAEILGSLDEKIELNRRTSQTLEQMAQALFRSWFVDFDPVKAKAAGKRPKNLAPEIVRLFPKEFEDSPLGPIPKGWTIGMLGDVAEISRNSVSVDKIRSDTPYIALEHMPKRCIALFEWSFGEGIESNKSVFNKGDILFGKLRPYFHKVGIAPLDGICSTDILVVAPKCPEWFGFAACHLSSDAVIEYADRSSTGTKMPRTNWNDLSKFEIVLPPIELSTVFSELFKEAVGNIYNNIFQSRTLSSLRDTLLPKLLSGEVKV